MKRPHEYFYRGRTRPPQTEKVFRVRAVLPAPLYAIRLLELLYHRHACFARNYRTQFLPPDKIIIIVIAHTFFMALIFIRTTLIFLTLLIVMRLMGKSQIGEMQPFEFIITLLIAELACIPMADSSIPLLYGIISIVAIFILHQIVWLLDLWFKPVKSLICGKPSVVITREGIDSYQLRKNNLDVSDLIESMRVAGYFNLDDVYYGLYEANGTFSALAKEEPTQTLPVTLIDSGKIDAKNVRIAGMDDDYIKDFIKKQNVNLKNVLVMTVDPNGRVYFQQKGKPYKILHAEVKGQW